MKTRVGIVGYGNLGKAVENEIKKSLAFDLVAVFSKRALAGTVHYSHILEYKDKIDILFLCGGSKNELEDQALFLAPYFNIVDAYDNHNQMLAFHKKLDDILCKNQKVAISAIGWDPGLFSLVRGLCFLLDGGSSTFWGKGLSQGHTNAIKNIPGVLDALQFTIPSKTAIENAKHGIFCEDAKQLHERHCYVVCEKNNQHQIADTIIGMKDYFEGYKTIVNFVSQSELDKMKTFAHKGEVISSSGEIDFLLTLNSNPCFTARVMTAFSNAVEPLLTAHQFGVKTIFDIPLSLILNTKAYSLL